MDVHRTPDDRFWSLPDFAFEPRSVEVDGLRMAYVEAGRSDAAPVLLLHGEPSWSFLYRHVMAALAGAGHRCVAPDLIGFGRSDKPLDPQTYTYARHLEWLDAFVTALDLSQITLVGQDWGGLLGLRWAVEHADRVDRIVASNTGLPTGDQPMPDVWHRFREAVRGAEVLDIGRLVRSGCRRPLAPEVVAAYDAPFPDEESKVAARMFPELMPTSPDHPETVANRAAWQALTTWSKPFLVAFSDSDPITGGMAPILKRVVPGAQGIEHPVIADAGHFLQEDAGAELGEAIGRFLATT